MDRKTSVKVVGYDNLIAHRQGFHIYNIDNDGLWLHNRMTDEITFVTHDGVLCYWYKTKWIYPQTARRVDVCVKQLS